MTEDIDTQAVVFRKAAHGLAAAMLPQAKEHVHIKLAAEILLDVADVFTGAEQKVREIEAGLSDLDEKARKLKLINSDLEDTEKILYERLDGAYWSLSDLLEEVSALLTVDVANNTQETPNADR